MGRTGGFAVPKRPSRSACARFRQRLVNAALVGVVLYSTVAATPPPVAARPSGPAALTAADAARAAFDPYRAVPAQPVPITVPVATGGGAGGDPSIVRRPQIPYAAVPTTRTELVDERTERTRTYVNPDGSLSKDISQGRLNRQWHQRGVVR